MVSDLYDKGIKLVLGESASESSRVRCEERGAARDSLSAVRLTTWGELAELVPDHLGRDVQRHVLLAVVHEEAHAVSERRVSAHSTATPPGKASSAQTHPMKFGRMVQAREAVLMGVLVLIAWLMPGKAVKAGPGGGGDSVSRVDEDRARVARTFPGSSCPQSAGREHVVSERGPR